jgi:hypothetical protein
LSLLAAHALLVLDAALVFDCLEKRYAELDQLCNPKPNSAAMRSLLRCKHEVGVAGV